MPDQTWYYHCDQVKHFTSGHLSNMTPLDGYLPLQCMQNYQFKSCVRKQLVRMSPWMLTLTVKLCQVATDIEEAAKIVMTWRYSVMFTNQCVYLHIYMCLAMPVWAVVYLQNAEQVDFLMAKSHVLPLKSNTPPRLELHAAVMAATLNIHCLYLTYSAKQGCLEL